MKQTLNMRRLADQYAQAGIDLCWCGAEFSRAARLLDARRLAEAETALKGGLDRLARVISEMPMREEQAA